VKFEKCDYNTLIFRIDMKKNNKCVIDIFSVHSKYFYESVLAIEYYHSKTIIIFLLTLNSAIITHSQNDNYRPNQWEREITPEDYNKSMTYFDKLILNHDGDGFARRGQLKYLTGDFKGALEDYNSGITMGSSYAYYFRAIFKIHNNDYEGAILDYLKSDSCTAISNGSPNVNTLNNLHEFMIEFGKSLPYILPDKRADSLLKIRLRQKLFLDEDDFIIYFKDKSQKIVFFSNKDHNKILTHPDDSTLFKSLVKYNFYQTYMIYLCMYPNGKFIPIIKNKLTKLMLQKAEFEVTLPDEYVNARESQFINIEYPYWPLPISISEFSRNTGLFCKGTYKIFDAQGNKYFSYSGMNFYPRLIEPGGNYEYDFWLSKSELCGGNITLNFDIMDCAGNTRSYSRCVHLYCR